MAGPGRPRKIQNEAQAENMFQEGESQPVGDAVAESPVVTDEVTTVSVEQPNVFLGGSVLPIDTVHQDDPSSFLPNDWQPISTVPHNGFPVKLTDDVSTPGIICFWRKTRAFANATHKWEATGIWTRSDNNMSIDFVPTHWKDRNAV